MVVPEGLRWEIVLIDNGSTDDTASVVQSFADTLPIQYVFEPMAGLSNARNRGVREALGHYVCWTDDDVLIDQHWLEAYVSAFRRYPDAAVFGGVIEPVPETPLPAWWSQHQDLLASVLAMRDFGPQELPLSVPEDRVPYGANFAVRAAEQRQRRYDPLLGVGPELKRLGEETEVLESILQEKSGVWVPDAKVKHLIPAHRLTLDYVGFYYRSVGETDAYLKSQGRSVVGIPAVDHWPRVRRVPLIVLALRAKTWIGYIYSKTFESSDKAMRRLMSTNYYAGAARYFFRYS